MAPVNGLRSVFDDGEWLGSVAAQDRLWWLPDDRDHEVVVMDELGAVGAAAGGAEVKEGRIAAVEYWHVQRGGGRCGSAEIVQKER